MGNTNQSLGKKAEELKALHKQVINIYETTLENKKEVKAADLEALFPNRIELCKRFTEWMKKLSYKQTANREAFIFACEILLLDSEYVLKEEYKNHSFNFIEIFSYMVLAKYPNEILSINKNDVSDIIKAFISLFLDETKDTTMINEVLGRMANKIFVLSEESTLEKFIKIFKENLPTAIAFGKRQMENLLLGEPVPRIPTLKEGFIMNEQILLMLGMTNNKILNQDKVDLLYSSKSMGNSFHRLAVSLKGYDAPVVILIKNNYDLLGSPNNTSIFGVFTNCMWQDGLSYFGNADTYIFKIFPEFKTYYAFNGKGGKEYLYLNTKQIANSIYKSGLGIGGGISSKARIWIDYDIMNKSYAEDNDMTFEKGIISQSPYDFLKTDQIEIWGFPDKDTAERQAKFLANENDAIINGRKIDKKEMFNQPGNELIMTKQYKFKDNLNIDFEDEKNKLRKD